MNFKILIPILMIILLLQFSSACDPVTGVGCGAGTGGAGYDQGSSMGTTKTGVGSPPL